MHPDALQEQMKRPRHKLLLCYMFLHVRMDINWYTYMPYVDFQHRQVPVFSLTLLLWRMVYINDLWPSLCKIKHTHTQIQFLSGLLTCVSPPTTTASYTVQHTDKMCRSAETSVRFDFMLLQISRLATERVCVSSALYVCLSAALLLCLKVFVSASLLWQNSLLVLMQSGEKWILARNSMKISATEYSAQRFECNF